MFSDILLTEFTLYGYGITVFTLLIFYHFITKFSILFLSHSLFDPSLSLLRLYMIINLMITDL